MTAVFRTAPAGRRLALLVLAVLAMLGLLPAAGKAAPAYTPITVIQGIPDATFGGLTADGSELWVGQNRNNKVAVIDTTTNTIKRTITLSGNHMPEAVVADPMGRFMLVVGYSGGLVWKIDTTTYQVLQTYPINDSVWNIAIKPDGSGFYAPSWLGGAAKTVQYVDIATGATTTINIPSRPDGLAPISALMSRDGSRVYVTGAGFGSPKVQGYFTIDTATNTIVDTDAYPVPNTSWDFGYSSALDPNTNKLYLLDEDSGNITVVDVVTGTQLPTITSPTCGNTDAFLLALTSVGTLMAQLSPYCGADDLTMIDPSTGATQYTFTTPAGGVSANGRPWGVLFSPNGCRVYTFNGGSGGGSPTWSTNGSVSVFGVPCPPDAPISPAITRGDGSLTVSYGAPDDHGSAITDYEYSLDGGTTWKSAGTTGTSFKISGLSNGTAYSVKVRAKNYYGAGAASAAVSGTPTAAAGAAAASAAQAAPATKAKRPSIRILSASVSGGSRMVATVRVNRSGRVSVAGVLGGVQGCTARATARKAGVLTVSCLLGSSARARAAAGPAVLRVAARLSVSGSVARDTTRSTIQPLNPTPVTG